VAKARARCWRFDWVVDVDIKSFFDTLDHALLMKALRHHIQERWVLLYVERWLKAPVRHPDGRLEERKAGVPQGGVISPVLANLYLHYAFDRWMQREHADLPFERYADDIVIHARHEDEAEHVRQQVSRRFLECGLTAHPDKTHIVYCRDGTRKQAYARCSFTFLGYEFRARRTLKRGRLCSNFSPAISKRATIRLCDTMRSWRLHRWVTADLPQLAQRINPILRGWIGYYGKFRVMDMKPVFRALNNRLVRWARKKHKRFRYNDEEARAWMKAQTSHTPHLFEHWKHGFTII
jgi:RNA-directed DNA polymerase